MRYFIFQKVVKWCKSINEITNQPFGELKFSISENVVDLLIAPLYQQQDKLKVVTRELLQNAFDACKKKGVSAKIQIQISQKSKYQYLEVRDNGIGMNLREIKDKFLTIGKTDECNNNVEGLVGKHGVGILSIFLIGEYAEVYTKKKDRAILSLKIYIENNKKQVEWLDDIPLNIKEMNEDSFTIVKIYLNSTFAKENMESYMEALGLRSYVTNHKNSIVVEYMGNKAKVPKLDKEDWFLCITENIKIYKMDWLNVQNSKLEEKDKQLKNILDQKGIIFYNDMILPVIFEKSAYNQLNEIGIPFIILNFKNAGEVEEDVKISLSRSSIQISGQVMKTIAEGIYKLEIDKMLDVLKDSKGQIECDKIDSWDLLKRIKQNSIIAKRNIDILIHKGRLLLSKSSPFKNINVWGDEMSAKQIIKGFQEPILYYERNMNGSFLSDKIIDDSLICVSVSYLDDYIYTAANSGNGLNKEALLKVLEHLDIEDVDINSISTHIWDYIQANRQKIKESYDRMAKKGIFWFNKSVILDIEEDIHNLVVFESSFINNNLDEVFYEMLRKKLSNKSFDKMVILKE